MASMFCLPLTLLTDDEIYSVAKSEYSRYLCIFYCCSVFSGISWQLLQRLQSVFNAAARLVFSARKSEHITPLLRELHWLKVPERIQFRLCVFAYRCLNGTAPSYLAETLHLTADVGSCRRLRSASTSTLVVRSTRRTTLGDRTFPLAAARAWNALRRLFVLRHRCCSSAATWRSHCSSHRTLHYSVQLCVRR